MVRIKSKEQERVKELINKKQTALEELNDKVHDVSKLIVEMLSAIPYANVTLRTELLETGNQNLKLIKELDKYC